MSLTNLMEFKKEDENNCWDDIRSNLSDDAEEICAWNGWHPIIKAQLLMFFGIEKKLTWIN